MTLRAPLHVLSLVLLIIAGCGSSSDGDGGDGGTGDSGIRDQGGRDGSQDSAWNRSGCKRGIAYGYHSEADLAAIQGSVSWWYNWAHQPDEDLRAGAYRTADVEYVPMVWGGNFDADAMIANIPDDSEWLLGFNEPNFPAPQANISAADAAALWPEVERVADAHDLLIASPAVNFCGGECQDTNPFDYLDDFFAACEGCRVDAVAFHLYVGCNQTGENKAQWLINHIETYKQRFSQPLWLTEFACTDAANFAEQAAFLEDAVVYLEGEPRIQRYAWFSGRFEGIPYVDLLGDDGELTELGEAYVNAPGGAGCSE